MLSAYITMHHCICIINVMVVSFKYSFLFTLKTIINTGPNFGMPCQNVEPLFIIWIREHFRILAQLNFRKDFRNKTPLYRINRPWIVDLRVLHGLGGVASYYGTLPSLSVRQKP